MKKGLFFSVLMGLAAMTQAQTLSSWLGGEPIAEGDTVSAQATGDELKFEPSFVNTGSSELTARIQVDRIDESATIVTSVCTGLLCMSGNMSAPFHINASSSYDDAYIDFYVPADAPMTRFKVTCFDTMNRQTRTEFYLKVYNATATIGIDNVETTATLSAFPNPARSQVTVRYNGVAENSTLAVYDMKGMLVREMPLAEREGTVLMDVSGLAAGIYLYGIKGSTMKKLVVR